MSWPKLDSGKVRDVEWRARAYKRALTTPHLLGRFACQPRDACGGEAVTAWSASYRGFSAKQRDIILRRDRICHACRTRPSTEADHIVNLAAGGANTIANGQGLCTPCHAAKTRAEQDAGRARVSRKRPAEPHPGTLSPTTKTPA